MADADFWTAEAITRLSTLWGEGHSMTKIALMMGTSKNSIAGKVSRLQLPLRGSPIKGHATNLAEGRKAEVRKPRVRSDGSVSRDQRMIALALAVQARREQEKVVAPPTPPPPPPPPARVRTRPCCYPMWGDKGRADPNYGRFCEAPSRQPDEGGGPYCLQHAGVCTTGALSMRRVATRRALASAAHEAVLVPQQDGDPVPLDLMAT